ncbi:MAG: hypothetical protein AB8G11_10305 [Saprospiraceae bacterium]
MLKQLLNILIIGVITLLLLEVTIRLCGVVPFRVHSFEIQSNPKFCLIPNEQYGFGLNIGEFEVAINKEVKYKCTHSTDSSRILNHKPIDNFNKTVDIHGCSFTYGMSVDDSLAFPFLLQQQFQNIQFRSFAVPGFGTIQALIRLQEQIKTNKIPDTLIICYAHFHDERNALNTNYRKSLYHGFLNANDDVIPLFEKSKIPYYDMEKGIQYCSWNDLYHNWSGRDYLATVNSLQNAFEKMQLTQGKSATHQILLEINDLCKANNVKMIVGGITKNESTGYTIEFCKQQGIATIDIGLELPSEEFSNLPYDIHPNEKAHRIFWKRLSNLFSN